MNLPVYLDNLATTKPDPRVVEAMLPYLREDYGNAASRQHEFGWRAEAAVEIARKRVARLIGAEEKEIIFTSGATESINLALKGVAEAYAGKGNHIITAATEHKAGLDVSSALERMGFLVTVLPVDEFGLVRAEDLERAIGEKTILVSIMHANNEIGTIHPIKEIGEVCRKRGILFHTDATQAVGKIPLDVKQTPIDLMSFCAHKMYGPKGVGALYVRNVRPAINLSAQLHGGGHERGLRPGTANVPAIAGFGKAAELAGAEMAGESVRTAYLRDRLEQRLTSALPAARINGHPLKRLPNTANISLGGARADDVMMRMKDVAVSSGSACSSASTEPSHVLRAIGLGEREARSSLRFGIGRYTTEEEIDYAVRRVLEIVGNRGGVTMESRTNTSLKREQLEKHETT